MHLCAGWSANCEHALVGSAALVHGHERDRFNLQPKRQAKRPTHWLLAFLRPPATCWWSPPLLASISCLRNSADRQAWTRSLNRNQSRLLTRACLFRPIARAINSSPPSARAPRSARSRQLEAAPPQTGCTMAAASLDKFAPRVARSCWAAASDACCCCCCCRRKRGGNKTDKTLTGPSCAGRAI